MLTLPFDTTAITHRPARIVTITRYDGLVVRIAEAQTDLEVSSQTFSPLAGFVLSAVKHQVGGEAASVQIDATMSNGGTFDTFEVVDGKWDNATVEVYVVDRPTLLTKGLIFKGFIGPTKFGALFNTVSFDCRGYVIKALWPFAQKFGPMCRADLGNDQCRVPLLPSVVFRSTAYVTRPNATFVDHYAGRMSNGMSSDPDQYGNVFFECTTAGVTAGSAPSYDFAVGNTTVDGSVTFSFIIPKCCAPRCRSCGCGKAECRATVG